MPDFIAEFLKVGTGPRSLQKQKQETERKDVSTTLPIEESNVHLKSLRGVNSLSLPWPRLLTTEKPHRDREATWRRAVAS